MEAVGVEEDFGSDPEEQEQLIPFHSTTKRGRPRLILKGFGYIQDKRGREVTYWRCEERATCKARMTTSTIENGAVEAVRKMTGQHAHPPDPTLEQVAQAMSSSAGRRVHLIFTETPS